MKELQFFIILQVLSTIWSAQFNKTCSTLNISGRRFKENETFQVETYGRDIYVENSIGIVNEDTFLEIPKILHFMAYNCKFEYFDFTSLYRMTYLESIDFNDVTGLPVLTNSIMLGFKHLKRLSLYKTDVVFDYNTFQNLVPLEYLSISKVDVTILGNDVFTGSSLKELYWTDSEIEKIDNHCLTSMKNIEIINLRGNKIEIFAPDTFDGLKHLERLYLNNNQLIYLNFKQFPYLPNLRYLDISRNNISGLVLEDVSDVFPNLTTIIVDRTSIMEKDLENQNTGLNVVVI